MTANRAEVIDQNFLTHVREGILPAPSGLVTRRESPLSDAEIVDLFESQVMSRHLDLTARLLKTRNESFYTIGSSGHEGNAVFGKAFRTDDMAFLHYRSGALFIQRSKGQMGSTPIYDMLLSLAASSEDPISGGRHKVFGSLPLLVPPQTSTIASHLPKALGMALSIRRAQDLGIPSAVPEDSIVLCNFGDASFNHASAQTAFNAALWAAHQSIPVPVVFICEDNGIGISVPTPEGWVAQAASSRPGWRYMAVDGLSLLDLWQETKRAVDYARTTRKPVFLHARMVRLLGHAGSDIEGQYHSQAKIEQTERQDPLLHSARLIIENGILSRDEVIGLYEMVRARVNRSAEYAIKRPKLLTPSDVMASLVPTTSASLTPAMRPSPEVRSKVFGSDGRYMDKPQHMAKLINWALVDLMLTYKNTVLFGEDVAQKGGVYNVTTGLYQKFGPRRVWNSLLDETSILGTAIGMAHNGFIPIPEIQFLAYVHNAEDQIRGEAATLSFFSEGKFTNPMVIRIAGLAYQKGFGGHFHNDNSLAVFRDIPGVILGVPAHGADAAKMLRTAVREAHEHGRVVVIVEPIALYMTKDLHEPGDGGWSFVYPEPDQAIALGDFGVYGDSETLGIITYGNGTYLSLQAAKVLERDHGIKTKIIDLRWLAPLDEERIAQAVDGMQGVLVVDECRRTGSISEALVTLLVERCHRVPRIQRVTADDSFIPLGKAYNVLLPSQESITKAALALLQDPDLGKESKGAGLHKSRI
jgi:2-oxoisovalerate dehydrogenase E1 component